LRAKQKT